MSTNAKDHGQRRVDVGQYDIKAGTISIDAHPTKLVKREVVGLYMAGEKIGTGVITGVNGEKTREIVTEFYIFADEQP